ncbi:MAG: chemotaxis protein CheW, partial [Firmicutes bacterium]|nr:chemotaxis protein CheW [Bacillota bacterium]
MRFQDVVWDSPEERRLFVEEATELCDTLEAGALSAAPDLGELFRAAHTLKGSGGLVGLDEWVAAVHALEDALDAARQGRRPWDGALQQAVLDTVDRLRAELAGAPAPAPAGPPPAPAAPATGPGPGLEPWRLTWDPATPLPGARAFQAWQAVAAQVPEVVSDPPPEALGEWAGGVQTLWLPAGLEAATVAGWLGDLEGLSDLQPPGVPQAAGQETVPAADPPAAAAPPAPAPAPAGARAGTGTGTEGTIRVPARVLERILEGLGELMLDEAQLAHRLAGADSETKSLLGHLHQVALGLQDTTLRARMLPLDTLFRQYPRAVHDMARQLGKAIRLEVKGGETELDRLVMDRLQEPLLHLLRNACDHGLEDPDRRRRAGKPAEGTVRLEAYAAEGHVHILVADDGAGIAWERVREKAVARGWLAPDAPVDPELLTPFLFRAGFSTAAGVSALSGRGVGLDAVQAVLDSLHGTVTVESEPGRGTTFHLELPMTMAILSALLVETGPWVLGIPVLAVDRILETAEAPLDTVLGRPVLTEGRLPVPVYRLDALLGRPPAPEAPVPPLLVRIRDGRTQAAVWVDAVDGQQEVVVKPVPDIADLAPWMTGVALLGDGRLALMLDLRRLIPATRLEEGPAAEDRVLKAGTNQMELLVFRLSDGQRYGINVYKTREIVPGVPLTAVPGQHPWTLGLWRLRGESIPVVSLHKALDLPAPAVAPLFVVTEFNQTLQAFAVDAVDQIVRVSWEQVQPLPGLFAHSRAEQRRFTGLIDHPQLGVVQLIDFEQILAQMAPPEYPEPAPALGAGTGGRQVWLADDSAVARQQVAKALAPLGVQVHPFPDGQACREALEAVGEGGLPDLLVLDVEMPRLDGYTLSRLVKADPRFKAIPVLLHTSLSGHWHAERAGQVAADAIVTKFDPALLARTAQALLLHTGVPQAAQV